MKKFGFIGFIFVLILALAAPQGMAAAKHHWKFAIHSPSEHVYTKIFSKLPVMIKEATKGEVEVTLYTAGELPYKATQFLKMCGMGVVDMAEAIGGYTYGDAPILALPDFPYLTRTEEELETFRKVVMPYVYEELRGRGVEPINWSAYGSRQIAASKPINTLADMKGLKVRTAGGLQDEIVKLWGGVPIYVSMAEVYLALQRGIMDAVMTALLGIQQSKSYEVAPYIFLIDGPVNHQYICVNQRLWQALSGTNQKAIIKAAAEWAKIWDRLVMHELDANALKEMVDKKQVKAVTKLSMEDKSKTREELLPILRDFVGDKMQPKGPEAFGKALKALNLKIRTN